MPYICLDCPNKTRFKREAYGSAQYNETQEIDEEEDYVDTLDTDYYDHEIDDYSDEVTCWDCDSGNTDLVDSEEWEDWKGPVPEKCVSWRDKLGGK